MITDTEIQAFVDAVQDADDTRRRQAGHKWRVIFSASVGPKYVRIIEARPPGDDRAVFCFLDRSNGDILMAAGWKAPAKHSRGNIANGVADLTPDGRVRYLR